MSKNLYQCQQCNNYFDEHNVIFITNKNDFVICNTCIKSGLLSQKMNDNKLKEKLYKNCFEKLCTTAEDKKYMKKYFKLMDGLKKSDLTKEQKLEKAFDQLNQWDKKNGI